MSKATKVPELCRDCIGCKENCAKSSRSKEVKKIMAEFDWKGYCKSLQDDNHALRAQIENMGWWIFRMMLIVVGLVILVITVWRA